MECSINDMLLKKSNSVGGLNPRDTKESFQHLIIAWLVSKWVNIKIGDAIINTY